METTRPESPTTVVMVHDFYSAVKSFLFQLIYFINSVFLKLIMIPGGFDDQSISNLKVAPGGKSEVDRKLVRKLKGVKDIPGPRVLPFIGTLLTSPALESKDLIKSNEDRMRLYGSLVKEELYWNFPMINILDADDIEIVMKKLGDFRPGMEIIGFYRSSRPDRYDSHGLVNSNGKDWEKVHKTAVQIITSPKYVKSMILEADRIAMDFTLLLDAAGPVVHTFEDLLKKYIAETSLYTVTGRRTCLLDDDNHERNILFEIHEAYWGAFHESAYGYPWWKYFSTNLWKRFVKAEDDMMDLILRLIQEAIDCDEIDGILGDLLKSKNISHKDKAVLVLEFITGGTEPVLATAVVLLHYLSKNKDISNRIYEELKAALPSKESQIDETTLDRLPYLKACIMETQRVCQVAPMLARISEQPIEIRDYEIPAYSLIVVHNLYASTQEKSFHRAKEFLPERWMYKDGIPPYQPHRRNVMMTFGTGVRACPGRRAATLHLTILMARLFRKYEIRVEGDLEMEFKWLFSPKLPISIGFYERQDE